jgi:hypothetical protein
MLQQTRAETVSAIYGRFMTPFTPRSTPTASGGRYPLGCPIHQLAAKNGQYGSISDTAKARWTKLIEYNEHDVKGMRHLVEYMLTWEEKQRGHTKPH